MASPNTFSNLGLSIIGVGHHYPPHSLKPDSLETIAKRFYPDSPAYVALETRGGCTYS